MEALIMNEVLSLHARHTLLMQKNLMFMQQEKRNTEEEKRSFG